MKILITGCGFIGYHLAKEVLQQKHELCVITRSAGKRTEWLKERGATILISPLSDRAACREAFEKFAPECVIHTAGERRHPEITVSAANELAAILKYLVERPKRLLHISSMSVYGIPQNAGGIVYETDILSPIQPYGEAKAKAEHIIAQACGYKIGCHHLRVSNIAGADFFMNRVLAGELESTVEPAFIEMGYDTKDSSIVRDYIHPDDLVKAIMAFVTEPQLEYPTYHIASGQPVSFAELLHGLNEVLERTIEIREKTGKESLSDIPVVLPDMTHTCEAVQWRPAPVDARSLADVAYNSYVTRA